MSRGCLGEDVAITSGAPKIATDLLHYQSRNVWHTSGRQTRSARSVTVLPGGAEAYRGASVRRMSYSLHWCSPIRQRKEMLMLDHPEKTAGLLATLKAAAPFEVELTERLVKYLHAQGDVIQTRHIVSGLSYAGDEGGIVCHMLPSKEGGGALVVSLTQVHVPR
jgi:hypothetical protein